MISRIFISILFSFLSGIHFFSCAKREVNLAIINNEKITLEEFLPRYKTFLSKTHQNDNLSNRYIFLNTLIDENLILNYAYQKSLQDQQNIIDEKTKIFNQLLLNEYHDINVIKRITTSENELRRLFTYYKTKLHVRHLFATDLHTILEIEQKLNDGNSWEILATEYFTDPILKNNGGDLGWYKMGELDPSFEIVAFSLNDAEKSKPIKTKKGYSIIQIIEREKDLLLTEKDYQNNKKWLEKMAIQYKKMPEMRKYTDKIAENMDIKFNKNGLHELYNVIMHPLKETIVNSDILVLTIKNVESLTINHCASLINDLSQKQLNQINTIDNLEDVLKGLIVRNTMIQNAIKIGLHQSTLFKNTVNEKYARIIINNVLKDLNDESKSVNWHEEYFKFRNVIADKSVITIDSTTVKSFPIIIKASIL